MNKSFAAFLNSLPKHFELSPEVVENLSKKTSLDVEIFTLLYTLSCDYAKREGKTLDEFVSACILEHIERGIINEL